MVLCLGNRHRVGGFTVAVGDIRVTIPEGSSVQIGRDGRITIAVATACDVGITPAQEASAAAKTAVS